MGHMNGIDALICAVLALGGLYGLLRGFVIPFLYLASFGVGFVAARGVAPLLMDAVPLAGGGGWGKAAWYALVFLGTVLLCRIVARRLKKVLKRLHLGGLDRTAGFAAGVLAACLLILFAVALEEYYYPSTPEALSRSTLFPLFQDVTRLVLVYLPESEPSLPRKDAVFDQDLDLNEGLSLTGPEEGIEAPAEEIILSWDEVEGAWRYELTLWRDQNRVMELNLGTTSFPLSGLAQVLEQGEYLFEVAAVDREGNAIVRSPSRPFKLVQ